MRILRPFSRYTKTFLITPNEIGPFIDIATGTPVDEGDCETIAENAVRRGWSDGFNYFLAKIYPVPITNAKSVSAAFRVYGEYIDSVRNSEFIEGCFDVAVHYNQTPMLMEIHRLMDLHKILYTAEYAIRCDNIIALRLILTWHDEKCENNCANDKDFVEDLSRTSGSYINLQAVKFLHNKASVDLEEVAYGLFRTRHKKRDEVQLSKIRNIAKFLDEKGIDIDSIKDDLISFSDIKTIEIFRVKITSNGRTLANYIQNARTNADYDILRLLLSWQQA